MQIRLLFLCVYLFQFTTISDLLSQNYQFVGDTIEVEIEGYKAGKIQWQSSSDKVVWMDIIGANKAKQDIIINQKGYYRAQVTDCDTVIYSAITTFQTHNKPIKIGVFGGSLSSLPESETAKKIWLDTLGRTFFKVETKGIGGAGFSALTKNNIPSQIRNSKPYDVYLLWASTNDYFSKAPVGDNFSNDTISQCGSIKYSINLIKQKNSDALIIFFTSLPFFYKDDNFAPYVSVQKSICLENGIPFLDQNNIFGITYLNSSQSVFYKQDLVHMTNEGYQYIGPTQAQFVKNEIYKFFNL